MSNKPIWPRRYQLTEADLAVLDRLDFRQRAILTAEGTYEEMAVAFGVPIGTIRSRLNRARKALSELHKAEAERT